MIIVLENKLCTAEHVLLCDNTLLTFTSMSWSLCRMTSSVLLTTSCCVSELYLPACHDHCAGWQALYCLTCPAVWQYCTNQHVMIILLDESSVLLNTSCCVSFLYLPGCHNHSAGWWALYCWTYLASVCNVLISMSCSLCWMTIFVQLTTSCCLYVLYLPGCHNHCAGWSALYCWWYAAVYL